MYKKTSEDTRLTLCTSGWGASLHCLLLSPDEKEKLETTTQRTFTLRVVSERPKQIKQKKLQGNMITEGEHSFTSAHNKAFPALSPLQRQTAMVSKQKKPLLEMEFHTSYHTDFAPIGNIQWRKREPAFPQPDNLVINPVLSGNYTTVQMETYPRWASTTYIRPVAAPLHPKRAQLCVNSKTKIPVRE
ncbi:uncharacterized protein LOC114792098 isoform X2 [Denticeps clupeoides]|uniref:uncharacterized protein LOC114792098 isoform X2 n=1 Tax=Denticeps clupeoides TaxID=299321 RepID=UPI0010A496FE|nr:uncharacterized protein LOC114792098 isoform X2 [Denticeps clupeoides]XP_028838808.1 uncharacterized protein LOC114792098 isoform X2 [Denticeps clupeoides]